MAVDVLKGRRPGAPALLAAAKVPEITAYFWITKVLTTGMGEATSDYLGGRLGTAIAMPLGAVALIAALVWQFSQPRYVAAVYWLAVVMVSVFGTMVADALHSAGVPYEVTTVVFGLALAGVQLGWFRSEKTLSVHSIHTRRREGFYWGTVVSTFALGTALGDMTASTLRLGYVASWVIFAVLITLPAIGYQRFHLNPIFAFWFAYIITRPLGASVADWMEVTRQQGGLGLGSGVTASIMTVGILVFVGYLALTRKDVEGMASS